MSFVTKWGGGGGGGGGGWGVGGRKETSFSISHSEILGALNIHCYCYY